MMMLALVASALSPCAANAQRDTSFAVLVSAGVGFGANVSEEELLPRNADNRGLNAMLRLMWKPDHRLRAGLETGWIRFTKATGVARDSSGPDPRSLYLDAVPMLITFSMNFGRVNVSAGAGYYLMLSYLHGEGTGASSSQLNYGIAASAEYLAPIGDRFGIGGGLGVYGVTQLGQYVAAVQLRAEYRAFEW